MPSFNQTNLVVSQNLLRDTRLAAAIIEKSSIGPQDFVYEIGPGKGILTAELSRRCRRVVAVEKDPSLSALLQERFSGLSNLSILTADFLDCRLPSEPYKVFSNIPFNITSAVVSRLANGPNPPEDSYLVMQKEAAGMYIGLPHECLRSVLLQPWFELELVHRFRRADFTPQPQVDAVLLRICKRKQPLVSRSDRQHFRDFVVFAFTGWRPALGTILKHVFSYHQLKQVRRELGIDLDAPPSALRIEEWVGLFEAFQDSASLQAVSMISGSEARQRRQEKKLQKVHRTRIR